MMFWRKKRPLSDFADEIEAHLKLEADELSETADRESGARRAVGNITSIKEAFYENRRWMLWDNLSRDFRHALRTFWRRPAFSAIVVVTLAAGMGATLAIFAVINAVILRPLPYKDPARLAMLWSADAAHGVEEGRVSILNFADWKSRNHAFADLTLFVGQTFLMRDEGGETQRMRSARVSADFFSMLGAQPQLGRVFSAEEEKRAEPVVVLSDRLWRTHFGASPRVLAADLVMDNRKRRIIGVMAATFQYPFLDTQVWEPVTIHPYWATRDRRAGRTSSNWYTLGRLRSGVNLAQAQAEMNVIARQLATEHAENRDQPEIRVVPLNEQTFGRMRLPLTVLFCAVVLMLLIACLNVANLLLASGSVREREFSVRRALGAGRARVAVQLLIESLVLALAGGGFGVVLAAGTLKAFIAFGPRGIPRLAEAHIDGLALLFTFGLSIVAAIFSGLWPAMRTGAAPTRSRQWMTVSNTNVRNLLVMGEFAIALALLAGAGLLMRSFIELRNVDLGFQPNKLLVMRIDLHVGRTSEQQIAYFREVIDRLDVLPGVRSAAAISAFLRSDPEDEVTIEGKTPRQPGPCDDLIAGPFFQTAGIPLKRGRAFSDQDRASTLPVAVVNEAMARAYWPNDNPIGKRFRFSSRKASPWVTVVGVAGDMRRQGIENRPVPQVFRPDAQASEDMLEVIVRTAGDSEAIAATVRKEIESIDRSVAKFDIGTVEQQLGEQTAERRFQTSLISVFSLIALSLSAIGIYGLMHYFVVQRTHEIGVRMALGARQSNVLALVVRQGALLAVGGIGVGIVFALGFTELMSKLLYGVSQTDPITFATTTAILLAVAMLASWLPARRAAKIDPMVALRQD
jgi:putative ABC transport system permease protein